MHWVHASACTLGVECLCTLHTQQDPPGQGTNMKSLHALQVGTGVPSTMAAPVGWKRTLHIMGLQVCVGFIHCSIPAYIAVVLAVL